MVDLHNNLYFYIFKYLGYNDADKLYNVSDKFIKLVQHYKWNDLNVCIKCPLKHWKEKYPNAVGVSIDPIYELTNEEFKYLEDIKYLSIIKQNKITDDALSYLKNIEELNMSNCSKITDLGLQYIKHVNVLNISYCNQKTISDKSFEKLSNLKILIMINCSQISITNNIFRHLQKLKYLDISHCCQFDDNIVKNIKSINDNVDVRNCRCFYRQEGFCIDEYKY